MVYPIHLCNARQIANPSNEHGTLCYKKPDPLPNIPRLPLRPMLIRLIQRRLSGRDIRLFTPHPSRPFIHFPKEEQRRVNHWRHIRRDEPARIESLRLARESIEPIEQRNSGKEDEAEPRNVGLKGGFEDEGGAGDVLSAERGIKADVGDRDGDPGEDLGDGGKVLEPGKDLCRAGGAGHVG